MKALLKLKIILVILITGLVLSCKDNKDGYSDEIDTRKTPVDTGTANVPNINNGPNTTGTNTTGATGTESEGVTGAQSLSSPGTPAAEGNSSTAGQGTGPGPNPKDGANYDISSQTKKDTTRLGPKAKAKVTTEKTTQK